MGRTLAFIADRVESSAHQASIAVTEVLSPGLRRLVLRCPDFAEATTDPCDVTALRVSRVDFRHYTPALLDPVDDAGELTIIVQRHGEHVGDVATPGHDLIEGWSVGDTAAVSQWSSTRAFHWIDDDLPVVLLGDATVISLAMAMERRTQAEDREFLAVLEVSATDLEAAQALLPRTTLVPATNDPGSATQQWLKENAEALRVLDSPRAFLAGHGQSIQQQRTFARDVLGFDRKAIRTQPYWATGKTGL